MIIDDETSCYEIYSNLPLLSSLMSKYSPQHPVLKDPQSMFLAFMWETRCLYAYETSKIIIIPVYVLILKFLYLRREDKRL
jgi:hypothetical protein